MATTTTHSPFLPQYGFGSTYKFDDLVHHHRFLYRVHTPKNNSTTGSATRSRATSPDPPSTPSPRSRAAFTRSAPSLSASVTSVRTTGSGHSDDYVFGPYSYTRSPSLVADEQDDDNAAPGDPYFLSRKFKDDLTSPDPGQRRRTISTLSSLSAGSSASRAYGYASEDGWEGSDAESERAHPHPFSERRRKGNSVLSRSTSSSVVLGHERVRTESLSASSASAGDRPGAKRSQSVDFDVGISSPSPSSSAPPAPNSSGARPNPPNLTDSSIDNSQPANTMTYADLVRHLDWTTRSSSPYVTTSFSFFWCLWEAVRRYKLGVKHDVEIAVIDARKVSMGRAKTALEVLRGVEEGEKQDKAYWKWYRFALESQDVLVFGAISGDAIYASIPLTQILPKLPAYFFVDDINASASMPKSISDPREPVPVLETDPFVDEDPRSPTSHTPTTTTTTSLQQIAFGLGFPSTPGKVRGRERARSQLSEDREREREALNTAHLLARLAWDIGTTLKPVRKSKPSQTPGKVAPRHTSHAGFCKALSASFARRSEAEQMRDATTGAVALAEVLVEPWFRARCAEYVALSSFLRDDEDGDGDGDGDGDEATGDGEGGKVDAMNESECLGLAGDGCTLEHSHSHSQDSSIQDALFSKPNDSDSDPDPDSDSEEESPKHEAFAVLSSLALSIARWPAHGLWWAEHEETVETLVRDVVRMCVREAARGVRGRVEWGIRGMLEAEAEGSRQRTRKRTISGMSGTGSVRSVGSMRSTGSRVDTMSLSGSLSMSGSLGGSLNFSGSGSERRGREGTRPGHSPSSLTRSTSSASTKHVRYASEDYSPSPSPSPSPRRSISLRESPYKPRARSPLGASPILGPAIVIRPKGTKLPSSKSVVPVSEPEQAAWSPSTPPPSPPRSQSLSEADLRNVSGSVGGSGDSSMRGRRSPPPPPRSHKRAPSPSASPSVFLPLPPSPSFSSSVDIGTGTTSSSPSSSLLKRSMHKHRRAESVDSIPGGWPSPGSSSDASSGDTDTGSGGNTPGLGSGSGSGDPPGSPVGSATVTLKKEQERAEKLNEGQEREPDVFSDDPSASLRNRNQEMKRQKQKQRPLSWAGSGIALGALGTSGAPDAVGATSSSGSGSESLPRGSVHSPLPLSSSHSTRRTPTRSRSESGSESLLAEVASSALGLASTSLASVSVCEAGAEAASESAATRGTGTEQGSSLRLDTSVSEQTHPSAQAPVRHRRHSSYGAGILVDIELSPVREDEDEHEHEREEADEKDEEGEKSVVSLKGAVGEDEGECNEVLATAIPLKVRAEEAHKEEEAHKTEIELEDGIGKEAESSTPPMSGTSTPRSERRRSRSGTLASIPEHPENWPEWAMVEVEVPSASASVLELQDEDEDERRMSVGMEMVEADVPLPPSPRPTLLELEDEDEDVGLSNDERKEGREDEGVAPSKPGVVPEITLTVDVREAGHGGDDDVDAVAGEGSEPAADHLSPRPVADLDSDSDSTKEEQEEISTATSSSRSLINSRAYILPFPLNLSLRAKDQLLAKTRVLLEAFFGRYSMFRTLRQRLSVSSLGLGLGSLGLLSPPSFSLSSMTTTTTTPMPSPIFEDVELPNPGSRNSSSSGSYLRMRLSRLFSFLHIPLFYSGPPRVQQKKERSMASILAPPPRWDAPIPECSSRVAAGTANPYNNPAEAGWDARSTSWAVSCFMCGITAALVLAAVQQHQHHWEPHMLMWNRYH